MILGTDRSTLRPLQSTDVEAIASYSVRPEFIRLFAAASTNDGNRCAIRRTGVANGQLDPKGALAGVGKPVAEFAGERTPAVPIRRSVHLRFCGLPRLRLARQD